MDGMTRIGLGPQTHRLWAHQLYQTMQFSEWILFRNLLFLQARPVSSTEKIEFFSLKMNFVETACVTALVLRRRRDVKRRRDYWVHPLISSRLLNGQFHKLFSKLKEHPRKFYSYYRMNIECFDQLLVEVGPLITHQNTVMRLAVPPEERLSVTLRYLATGNSFLSLHFEYLLGDSTIRSIVRETCEALWKCLLKNHMPALDEESWLNVAKEFHNNTDFPNCIGAVDGKHVRLNKPDRSGSEFFNYKSFFSVVLLAIVDSKCNFIFIDVGAFGSSSDSNIFKKSVFSKLLEKNELSVPGPAKLPHDDGKAMPFVLVGDEAFALSEHVLRPYPSRNLSTKQRIFNYRLTRARRVVECAFGILANKWRIFHRALDTNVEFSDIIIKASCILHNFIRKREIRDNSSEDMWYDYECPFNNMENVGTRGNREGASIRDDFASYFTSPQGCVPWQYNKI